MGRKRKFLDKNEVGEVSLSCASSVALSLLRHPEGGEILD